MLNEFNESNKGKKRETKKVKKSLIGSMMEAASVDVDVAKKEKPSLKKKKKKAEQKTDVKERKASSFSEKKSFADSLLSVANVDELPEQDATKTVSKSGAGRKEKATIPLNEKVFSGETSQKKPAQKKVAKKRAKKRPVLKKNSLQKKEPAETIPLQEESDKERKTFSFSLTKRRNVKTGLLIKLNKAKENVGSQYLLPVSYPSKETPPHLEETCQEIPFKNVEISDDDIPDVLIKEDVRDDLIMPEDRVIERNYVAMSERHKNDVRLPELPAAIKALREEYLSNLTKTPKAKVTEEEFVNHKHIPLDAELYVSVYRMRSLRIKRATAEMGETFFSIKAIGTSTELLCLTASGVGKFRSLIQLIKERDNNHKKQDSLDIEITIPEKFRGKMRLTIEGAGVAEIDAALSENIILKTSRTKMFFHMETSKEAQHVTRDVNIIAKEMASLNIAGGNGTLHGCLNSSLLKIKSGAWQNILFEYKIPEEPRTYYADKLINRSHKKPIKKETKNPEHMPISEIIFEGTNLDRLSQKLDEKLIHVKETE